MREDERCGEPGDVEEQGMEQDGSKGRRRTEAVVIRELRETTEAHLDEANVAIQRIAEARRNGETTTGAMLVALMDLYGALKFIHERLMIQEKSIAE